VNGDEFWQYKTGIIPADLCTTNDDLNHSMLAIGFGIENEIEYALIQNQWGSTWGDNGFSRLNLMTLLSGHAVCTIRAGGLWSDVLL